MCFNFELKIAKETLIVDGIKSKNGCIIFETNELGGIRSGKLEMRLIKACL